MGNDRSKHKDKTSGSSLRALANNISDIYKKSNVLDNELINRWLMDTKIGKMTRRDSLNLLNDVLFRICTPHYRDMILLL